ncbi:Glucose-1-phosphate thymidylyltransferase [hydrothermal vent metagenome]|uniref:Glucose-1-phosphate thymidylyltransferase n=1 Tax=hydrothermal vent metagenome TaxID=652676 RepID=A0A3B0WHN3_9ZZZZ
MKAMILAAGRGERLRPLTDETPKPLIKVAGKSLIEYHLENLANAGFKEIIINTAWLAEKIHQRLGDGSNYGVNIKYSDENEALETAGGIINALPLLGNEAFVVVNGDIWCDFNFSTLPKLKSGIQSHLVLVKNPQHNPEGDFTLQDALIKNTGKNMRTFSGIGLYTTKFFAQQEKKSLPLAPIIRKKCETNLVSGQYYDGLWTDVGTVERLQVLEDKLTS